MSLSPGARLGPYEVTALIGRGGMGEVYRARDTKLQRDVALKVLPDLFANDPERLARFQREAQVLASLNHPNIAIIHGLEEADPSTGSGQAVKALVLEFVEGPTLADRITQGPILLDESLPIAKQIADALEAAHEHGIIHRDLKPANVKVRPDGVVKVLDFGLAKLTAPSTGGVDLSQAPTLTTPAVTGKGVIMGTAAYMSPEQAKGRPVDKRSDIWAFGCVLYEMLTGKRAFEGSDVSEVLAGVIKSEPDWTALPSGLPEALRAFVRRCLEKDPRQRVRDIGDVRLAMGGAFDVPAPEAVTVATDAHLRVWQRPIAAATIVLMAVVLVSLATGLAVWTLARSEPPAVTRLTLTSRSTVPLTTTVMTTLALPPDGRTVVYVGRDGGVDRLYLRRLDQLEASLIAGTEGGGSPFFAPDGQWVGFASGGELKKVRLAGGPPTTVCELPGSFRGGSWGADGVMLFGAQGTGLWRVPAVGGKAEPVTTLNAGEIEHNLPEILPGGKAALFTFVSGAAALAQQIGVVSLETGERRSLVDGTTPHFASTGHIVFWQSGSLWAVPFDVQRLETTGEPVPVLEGVEGRRRPIAPAAQFALGADGTIVYVPGGAEVARTLVWVDRDGREEPLPGIPPDDYQSVRLSPDGARLAVATGAGGAAGDVWTYDVARATMSRLTTDAANDQWPLWTLDGQRIIFTSRRGGRPELFSQRADGTGQAERLWTPEGALLALAADAWSPDGRRLVFVQVPPQGPDIGVLSLEGEPKAEPLIQTAFVEDHPAISPDGRWIAYNSNLSGSVEIYVERFPELGDRQKISTSGGSEPLWSPDGRELFYLSLDGRQVFAVPIATEARLTAGVPKVLFEKSYVVPAGPNRPYRVTPDGKRFVMIKPAAAGTEDAAPPQIIVVLNWFEELKRRVPTRN